MDQFTNRLYTEMNRAFQGHAIEADSALQKAQRSAETAGAYLRQLKEFIIQYNFKDQKEEIRFFKEIKPMFLREQIYYTRLYQIEAEKPMGSKAMLREYFQKVLDNITAFYEANRYLFHYYRAGRTDYDDKIFIRNAENGLFLPEYSLDIDNRFSTVYSQKIARMQAFEHVADYALSQMDTLEHSTSLLNGSEPQLKGLVWTDSIISLVELIMALHATGAFNNGKIPMKQIVTQLANFFNVRLDNFYQIVKSVRGRKKVRMAYLHHMIERGEKKMDDTDMDF